MLRKLSVGHIWFSTSPVNYSPLSDFSFTNLARLADSNFECLFSICKTPGQAVSPDDAAEWGPAGLAHRSIH